MSKLNVKQSPYLNKTHEGAQAVRINATQELRRSVMACMLWEDTFYEDGVSIADRIAALVKAVPPKVVALTAIEARSKWKLRHVPLLLVREMARYPTYRPFVAETLANIIQRADELTEFLAIYWKDGKQPLAKQVKLGLAAAFTKFDPYQLAKYNRDNKIKLRDVLKLVHAKPKSDEQAIAWRQLVKGELPSPDTWEVALSSGADKRTAWTRLLTENKLGGLALIRNLRNMTDAKVDPNLIRAALASMDVSRVLPFRFIAAAKAAPQFESELDATMLRGLAQTPKIPGKTVIVIDVSGSMYGKSLSAKSDMDRVHAAAALGAIVREVCEEPRIYATAGNDYTRIHQTQLVPNRHGMALVDAIYEMRVPLGGGGIFLNPVCRWLREREENVDRMIVITDEQDCAIVDADRPGLADPLGTKANYLINVAQYKNGIGYGKWTHIDGFSEAIMDYIREAEQEVGQIGQQ